MCATYRFFVGLSAEATVANYLLEAKADLVVVVAWLAYVGCQGVDYCGTTSGRKGRSYVQTGGQMRRTWRESGCVCRVRVGSVRARSVRARTVA